MMNTVDISGKKKKKIENRKRNKINKKEEIRTNLLYKQIKIKEKIEQVRFESCIQKKNQ